MKKIEYFDGLRGLAAMIVYLHHVAWAFYPALFLGVNSLTHSSWEGLVYGMPAGIIVNGRWAVYVFFVISGFFTTYQRADHKTGPGAAMNFVISRWVRITGPGLVSVLVGYLIVKSGWLNHLAASMITGSTWLSVSLPPSPNFWQAISEALLVTVRVIPVAYNQNLWPLSIFFFGSIIIYVYLAIVKKQSIRTRMSAVLAMVLLTTPYAGFFLGSFMADWYPKLSTPATKKRYLNNLGWALMLGAVLLGSFPLFRGDLNTAYRLWLIPDVPWDNLRDIYYQLAAAMFVLGVLFNTTIQSWLTWPIMVRVGRISFSIFVIHLAVIVSIGSTVFLAVKPFLPYDLAVLVSFVATSVSTAVVSKKFYRWVEKPFHRLSVIVKGGE